MTVTSNASSSENTIEKAFGLLHEGKGLQSKGEHWKAADKFVQARQILDTLARQQARDTDEERQIAELYKKQAREYLNQSRQCLIEAMKQEKESDEHDHTELHKNLTDEEAETRIRTFYSLYSRKMNIETRQDENVIDQQWSIEERLQELNASLPHGFKTSDERMNDLNRGLNRLGLSLYTQKEPFARFQDTVPKDDDEQVADIIAQAKDEVAAEKQFGKTETPSNQAAVDEDNGDEEDTDDSEDEEDEGDALLDDDQLAIKLIRRRAVRAQVKLAELVALLDEAKSTKQEGGDERELEDDDSADSIEKPNSGAYLASGKKKLKSAQKDLKKALNEWIESLL
jgi:hypothetical protein